MSFYEKDPEPFELIKAEKKEELNFFLESKEHLETSLRKSSLLESLVLNSNSIQLYSALCNPISDLMSNRVTYGKSRELSKTRSHLLKTK